MKFVVSVSNLVNFTLNVQVEESKRVVFHEHLRDLVFNLNQYVREAGDAVRQAVGVEREPHKSAAAQRRQSVYHSSITIAATTVMLLLATVLLPLVSSVTVWKSLFFLSSHPHPSHAERCRAGLCMARLQCAVATWNKLRGSCVPQIRR